MAEDQAAEDWEDPVSVNSADVRTLARQALSDVRLRSVAKPKDHIDAVVEFLVNGCLPGRRTDLVDLSRLLDEFAVTQDELLKKAIPDAARALGDMWLRDEMSFSDVTLGTGWLMHLFRANVEDWQPRPASFDKCLNILLVTPPMEQHLLGPSVLKRELREAGHSVQTLYDADADALTNQIEARQFEAVFISVGSLLTLDAARDLVVAMQSLSGHVPRVIVGGAILTCESSCKQLRNMLQNTLITNDAYAALLGLERSVDQKILKMTL